MHIVLNSKFLCLCRSLPISFWLTLSLSPSISLSFSLSQTLSFFLSFSLSLRLHPTLYFLTLFLFLNDFFVSWINMTSLFFCLNSFFIYTLFLKMSLSFSLIDDEKWGLFFDALLQYGEEHGHCNAPQVQ